MISEISTLLEVPCLHRIFSEQPIGSHKIHYSIGMSIDMKEICKKLKILNNSAIELKLPKNSVLVTFDDGWVDSKKLIGLFQKLTKLQPVLFLTTNQLSGDSSLLPLPRLYEWCNSWSLDLEVITQLGISREWLKSLPENTQHKILDSLNIPQSSHSDEIINSEEIELFIENGWIVGSHAHDHHDLRLETDEILRTGLKKALDITLAKGGLPWLAWPEGRCDKRICLIAGEVGFTKQFSLNAEAGMIEFPTLIHREIWS